MEKKPEPLPEENFRGLSADSIEAIIDLQYQIERVRTLEEAERVRAAAIKANVFSHVLGNPLAQAREAEEKNNIEAASVWYQLHHVNVLDDKDGPQTSPLRAFVVKHGLVKEAEQYFIKILNADEWRKIALCLFKKSDSHENYQYDVITAFKHYGDTEGLERVIKRATESGRLDLAEEAAAAIPRALTQDEARQIVRRHLNKAVIDNWVEHMVEIIQKYNLDDLREPLLDEVAKQRHPEKYVRATAKKLGMELTVKQLQALYGKFALAKDTEGVVRLAHELAGKSAPLKKYLPEAYKFAKNVALSNRQPLEVIDRYAKEAGEPLTIDELLGYWRYEPKLSQDARAALKRASKMLFVRDNRNK